MEDHEKEPIILTSPGRMTRGLIIVGITLAVGAAVVLTLFDDMIKNPPPVSRIAQPGPPPPPPPPPQAGTTTIAMLSGASVQGSPDYGPDNANVPLGNSVVWRNDDTFIHTATSGTGTSDPNNAKIFDTKFVNPAESSDPVKLAGVSEGDVIDYYCQVHPFMAGKLTITAAESGQPAPGPGGQPAGPTVHILAGSSTQGNPDYDPDSITVKKGDKINVVNQDTTLHTITNGEGATDPQSAKLFDTGFMEGGSSATIDTAALDPASYKFYCQVHPYMSGTLVVE